MNQKMEPSYEEFPDEIWELILSGLGDDRHPEFESLSLVSKRFLSLTDRLRHRFTVVDQTYFIHGTISRLVNRFQNLKTLDLSRLRDGRLETALREIARSSVALNLETLDISNHDSVPIESLKELGLRSRKIKVLNCANVVRLCDEDLIAIAKFYPDLEELDISYPRHKFSIAAFRDYNIMEIMITDAGIEVLSSGLKNLTKINISMNPLLTDQSLFDLSSNCLRLKEISFAKCTMITTKGVRFMLHNSPNLRSISMFLISSLHGSDSLFMNPAISGRALCSLHFKDSEISDEFLNSIVEARIPLRCVSLSGCTGYSIMGILTLLHAYQSLTFLDLTKSVCLSDEAVIALSRYLHDLVSITLSSCINLTCTALLAVINNCPFLESIEMEETKLGSEEDKVMDVMKHLNSNSSIKTLNLARSSHLSNECLVKITSVCPNLKQLDLSSCSRLLGSLGEIFNICPEIKHLNIHDCVGVIDIGLEIRPLKLKTLYMARSGVNDEGLMKIAVRCKELEKIELAGCQFVTTDAVKLMVTRCEKLREVNMMGCPNLHVYMVDWLVFTRPSLRKLIPPSYAVTTESQRRLWLRHGCQVCDK